MIGLTRANSLAVVASAANRAAGRIHEQHGRGLTSLATISATAPFVGATGNIYWLLSFPSSGERTRLSLTILRIVSHSLWFTEAGLLIAIVSYAGYRYFRERRKDMRGEMRAAVVELVATLRVCFAGSFPAERAKPHRESRFASAERAMERSLRHLSHRLRRKIPKLTSIAAAAPMLGTLSILTGFISAFMGIGYSNGFGLRALTGGFAQAFAPMPLALIAATFGTWARDYLISTSADLEAEICIGANELLNTLKRG